MLRAINEAVSKQRKLIKNERMDFFSPQFATCALGTFDYFKGTFQFSYAGHHAILMRRHGVWHPLGRGVGSSLPLGIIGGQAYANSDFELEPDDWFLMYSDALFEIIGKGSKTDQQDLISLLGEIREAQSGVYFQKLLTSLAALNESELYPDDFTLMLLEPRLPEQNINHAS